jgi:phage FluMu protein Com
MNYPMITIEGKDYYQIACSKCETANAWKIYTDGKGYYQAKCECGHTVAINTTTLKREPDTT